MFYIVREFYYRFSSRYPVYFIIKCPKKYKIVEKLKWHRPFFPLTLENRCTYTYLSSITVYVNKISHEDLQDLRDKWMSGRELEEKIRRILEKLFDDRRIIEKRMKKLKEFIRKKIKNFERKKYAKKFPYVRRFDYHWYTRRSLKNYIFTNKSLMTLTPSSQHIRIVLLKKIFAIERYFADITGNVILIELPYNTSAIEPRLIDIHRDSIKMVINEDLLRELEEMRDEIDMNDEQKQYFEKAVHVIKYLITLKEILSA